MLDWLSRNPEAKIFGIACGILQTRLFDEGLPGPSLAEARWLLPGGSFGFELADLTVWNEFSVLWGRAPVEDLARRNAPRY